MQESVTGLISSCRGRYGDYPGREPAKHDVQNETLFKFCCEGWVRNKASR